MKNFHPKLISFYPPYIGAGIYVENTNRQQTDILVSMKLRWYNRNLWNVHFGGSLYSMCDPWYMHIIQRFLGSEYVVWDKAAAIRFKKPAASKVSARFHIDQNSLDKIKTQIDSEKITDFNFKAQVIDSEGIIVAEIDKTVYANSKQAHKIRLAKHRAKNASESDG